MADQTTSRVPLNRSTGFGGLLAIALTAAVLTGCYSEGGLGWSEDQFTYVSRPYQPWNLSLQDTRTGDEIWSVELPVGKQLVIHFLTGQGVPDSMTPDLMEWALMDEGVTSDNLANTLPVPAANSRILKPTLRPTPEFPPKVVKSAGAGSGGGR